MESNCNSQIQWTAGQRIQDLSHRMSSYLRISMARLADSYSAGCEFESHRRYKIISDEH